MCRFNLDLNSANVLRTLFQYNPCVGSITTWSGPSSGQIKFQYNPCVGSIQNILLLLVQRISYFNTTLVSVQYTLTTMKVADLGNFNTTLVSVQFKRWMSIYLRSLVISIQPLCRFNLSFRFFGKVSTFNFNTTLVSVQSATKTATKAKITNFNTTLVSVQSQNPRG